VIFRRFEEVGSRQNQSRKHGPAALKSQVASYVACGDVIGHWSLGAPSVQSQARACGPQVASRKLCRPRRRHRSL